MKDFCETNYNSKPESEFYETTCNPFIDPQNVDAYFRFELNLEEAPTTLYLDSSWGCTGVDLGPLIKNAETITHLFLSPVEDPTSLQYNREDYGRDGAPNGGVDCIHGDELSRIISMQLLKDVDQSKPVKDGDVFIFNENTGLFEPYPLKETITNIYNQLNNHETRISSLEVNLSALIDHVDQLEIFFRRWLNDIEARIAPPPGCPANARIVHGNINDYSDWTNSMGREWGLFSHDLSQTIPNDQYFA